MTIFVFGTDGLCQHVDNYGKEAVSKHGAQLGKAGSCGQSFAIKVRDASGRHYLLPVIRKNIAAFVTFATWHSKTEFKFTPIACNHYSPAQIAPMLINAGDNVVLPHEFTDIILAIKRNQRERECVRATTAMYSKKLAAAKSAQTFAPRAAFTDDQPDVDLDRLFARFG
jgi:hypothetical protein